jgi:dipeptidyl aminopeptidase/acylaminoacyl peptidase
VDCFGPSNLVTVLQNMPAYWESMRAELDKRIGNVEKDQEFLRSRSPLFKADEIKIPMLIAQGANAPRVKRSESDQFVNAIKRNGKSVEYMVFPDEGHGFWRPENKVKFYAQAESFLSRNMGSRVEASLEYDKPGSIMQ